MAFFYLFFKCLLFHNDDNGDHKIKLLYTITLLFTECIHI